jgi:hypothetical protein
MSSRPRRSTGRIGGRHRNVLSTTWRVPRSGWHRKVLIPERVNLGSESRKVTAKIFTRRMPAYCFEYLQRPHVAADLPENGILHGRQKRE